MYPKQILFSVLVFFFSLSLLNAQDFTVPENYSLVAAEDYEPYKQDILSAINWLENTSFDQQKNKRVKVSAFFMQWLMGSPTVSVSVSAYTTDLSDKNAELLMIFLGGWTKYSIEKNYKITAMEGNLAGIKSVLAFYKKNRESGIKKNKIIEKLLKLKTEKDIEKWLKKNL